MIKCAIVDDENYSNETLTRYIEKTDGYQVLATFNNANAALRELTSGLLPDILFLDIEMPELSGLDLALLIPPHIAIIYVTANSDYALPSFASNVYDFLLKPVSYPKFLKSMQKIKGMLQVRTDITDLNKVDYIFINPGVKGRLVKLYFSEIIYIEGLKNYVIFNQQHDKHITYLTMREIEDALPSVQFIRINKSFIINFSKVKAIEGNMVVLHGNIKLQVGGNYKETLKKLIMDSSIISAR